MCRSRGRLFRRQLLDVNDLPVGAEIAQHVGPSPRGQHSEDLITFFRIEVFNDLGGLGGVMVPEEITQGGRFARPDQFAKVGHQQRVSHSAPPWTDVERSWQGRYEGTWRIAFPSLFIASVICHFVSAILHFASAISHLNAIPKEAYPMTSFPTYGRKTSGTSTRPSARW